MKKILLIIFALVVTTSLTLWVKGKDMREVRTEISIAAPPAKVWKLITDIENWKEWSPVIKDASGKAVVGSKLSITMCGKEGKEGKAGPKYEPVIKTLEEPKQFSWTAKMMAGFIFTNGKIIELEETGSGTRLVHKETFSGLMVPMMWSQMEGEVPKMLNSMNEALKALAEKN